MKQARKAHQKQANKLYIFQQCMNIVYIYIIAADLKVEPDIIANITVSLIVFINNIMQLN